MFVENERVFNFSPVGNKTLEEIKEECFYNFLFNLEDYVLQPKELHPKSRKHSLEQYVRFNNKYSKTISYNSKNRQFYNLYTDLIDFVKSQITSEGSKKNVHLYDDNTKTLREFKIEPGERNCQDLDIIDFYVSDFTNLFSRGEFPFMGISIVRVGNYDYYFYTITR